MSNHAYMITASKELTNRIVGKSDYSQRLLATANQLHASMAALVNMHDNPNQMLTGPANFAKVQAGAVQLDKQGSDALTKLSATMGDGTRDIQKRIDAKVNLTPDDQYAREIRDRYNSMNISDQHKLMVELANCNSGPELAAIIEAPRILTGITDELQNRFRALITDMHAPEEIKEMKALLSDFESASTIVGMAKDFTRSISNPAKLAAIQSGERKALAAEAAFNAAV